MRRRTRSNSSLSKYDPLEGVVEAREALKEDAPVIWPEEAPGNLAFLWRVGDSEKTEGGSALRRASCETRCNQQSGDS